MEIRTVRDLAAAVRGRRTDLGLTQADVARRAGVARKSISELESGKTTPAFAFVLRVSEALGLVIEARKPPARRPRRAVDLDAILERHRSS